jgi:hypothetical protein
MPAKNVQDGWEADMPRPSMMRTPPPLSELSSEPSKDELLRAYATMAAAYYQQWPAVFDELAKHTATDIVVRDSLLQFGQKLVEMGERLERMEGRRPARWLGWAMGCLTLAILADVAFRLLHL